MKPGERGMTLVELVIGIAITTIILGVLGAVLVATLRHTRTGTDQQYATQQLRNALFWLNHDTQSGVASLATVAPQDVTLRWTDYATGAQMRSRIYQSGEELVRELTVDGSTTARTIARGVPPGGFAAQAAGPAITYTLSVRNGASVQSQTETTTMRVSDLPLTPFATTTPAPTRTFTPTSTLVPTNTPTPTPTATHTVTHTPTPTLTPTPTATPTASANWIVTGTYTGDGVGGREIDGLPWRPDIVIVRSDANDFAVIRTGDMPAGASSRPASNSALLTDRVESFTSDGFVIGDHSDVNRAGRLYHWVAMREGSNVRAGTYTGNGTDNRTISGVGLDPDWLLLLPDGARGTFRPGPVAGDASYRFDGGNSVANRIQALTTNGFQVGSHAEANQNGRQYYYIAFTESPYVAIGTYTGNGADNRNVTGLGISPSVAWVKAASNHQGRWRTDTTSGDRSLHWQGSNPNANRIQALIADGFQVGSHNEVNRDGFTFYYLALDDVPAPSTPTPTATNTPTPVPTATNTPVTCTASGLLSPSANAPDTGGTGNGFEANPTGAYANGGTFATNDGGNGDRHRYYNYGITVPGGCSVAGIEVRLDYWLANTGGANSVQVQLSWDGGTSWTAAKSDTSEPTGETAVTFGSSSDTWGHAWTASDLSNANFRVRVTTNLGNGGQEVYLDWIAVRVHYTP